MRATRLVRPGAGSYALEVEPGAFEVGLRAGRRCAPRDPTTSVPSFTHALRMRCCRRSVTSSVRSIHARARVGWACCGDCSRRRIPRCTACNWLTCTTGMTVKHVVVDGSNIATEGRTAAQLAAARRGGARVPRGVHADDTSPSSSTRPSDTASTQASAPTYEDAVDRRRARHPAGRRDRARRRVRAADRRPGRRRRPLERLVPGVPRRVRVAVRRGAPDRRQAGAPRRLGVRAAQPGAAAHQPPRGARRR